MSDGRNEMVVGFPGGKRVAASYNGFAIHTDQSEKSGGEASAPEPFDLFLASLATCAGFYVLRFCENRDISMEGLRLVQSWRRNEERKIVGIDLRIELPEGFPDKYRAAVVRAAEQCSVKKVLHDPPEMTIEAV